MNNVQAGSDSMNYSRAIGVPDLIGTAINSQLNQNQDNKKISTFLS